ncbi:hypothetical protein IW261DRAFT_1603056 [Armillaria novae-zelandiae]|uniref:RING-type domain-containing protein n=1 Tax=Armillaria novae-zelandiae TaxID=153914 RepID=A0AA39PTD2_9AGAR|nr:hypothetical protein IW261DRAFT_1603056 [Armillaria novae-zelandiae]
MSTQCTICLCDYTEPVSIPCGHVYCLKCVSDHILSSSPDGFAASCPTRRTSFYIGKFFSFLSYRSSNPSLHNSTVTSFQAFKRRLDALEMRNSVLERENRALKAAVAKGEERAARNEKQFKVTGKKMARVRNSNKSVMSPPKRPRPDADSSSSTSVPSTERPRLPALQAFERIRWTKRSG